MSFFQRHPFFKSILALITRIWVVVLTLTLALGTVGIVLFAIFGFSDTHYHVGGHEYASNRILSLKVSGVIVGDSDEGFAEGMGVTPGYAVKQQLYKAADEDSYAGVILEINSPGGTINGAQAIADGVNYYREQTKRPVFAHVQGLGASGGYWAAISADRVIADHGSDVGSIGVLMGPFKYYNKVLGDETGVVTENGIESYYITAGKSKDAGDPYRRLSEEEIAKLQTTVNNEYDRFVKYVGERRKINEATIRDQLGALTYDTKSAQDNKLIDGVSGREETYKALAEAAEVADDYEVVRPKVLDENAAGASSLAQTLLRRKNASSPGTKVCDLHSTSLAYSGDVHALCQKN